MVQTQSPKAPTASAEPTQTLDADQEAMLAQLQRDSGMDPVELREMLAAVRAGQSLGDFYGYTPAVYNAMEKVGLAYYRAGRIEPAAQIFGLLVDLTNGTHASAWRALGACHQVEKHYRMAIVCYNRALDTDPTDLLSRIFAAECWCYEGRADIGLPMLNDVLAKGTKNKAHEPYLARARAIVAAKGGLPKVEAERQLGKALYEKAIAELDEDDTDDPAKRVILKDPALRQQLRDITEAVNKGRLTIKEVAGFTDEQFEAGYAAACKYLELGQPTEALKIVGWLMWLDSRDARFYHLGGLCMHHLKLWCIADYLYTMALMYDTNNFTTMIYQGETKIMNDEKEAGFELVRRGIALAQKHPSEVELIKRGQTLLKQFGT
jgi:tetratricopeptide (TPR) repeat protein